MTACERIRHARNEQERLQRVWGDMVADAVETIAATVANAPAASHEEVDFSIENHGSIVLLRPLNGLAETWVEDHVGYEQTFGDAVVVEHRYIAPIIEGLEAEGFTWEGR